MMVIFATILIAVFAGTAVLAPLIHRGHRTKDPSPHGNSSPVQELLDKRDTLINSLRDLEHDWGLGNISDARYENLQRDYEGQAIAVLKSIDAQSGGLEQRIEAEVADLNNYSGNPSESTSS